jgi:glycosyltransferase involved in cell wall biosynthesis
MAKKLLIKFPYASTFGGGEKHTLTLIDELPFDWVALTSCAALIPELRTREIPVRSPWMPPEPVTPWAIVLFTLCSPITAPLLWRHVWKMKKEHDVDVALCLSLTEKVLLAPWAWLIGLRLVWIEHVPIGRWLRWNPWRLPYVMFSSLATVVAVSEYVGEQLRDLGDIAPSLKVIPNGIDDAFFGVESLPYEGGVFELLYVGRLSEEKGLGDLLKAVRSMEGVRLRVVGDGPEREQFEREAPEHVDFVGFSDDISSEMSRAHCVVVPSHKEAFGLAAAEALASSTPVIVTRVGGLPDVVRVEEWLVDPHAPEQLAQAILKVRDDYDEARQIAAKQKKRIAKEYSMQNMLGHYNKMLS